MTEPRLKVVIYLRVSSSEQTADNQLPALEKRIADKSDELVEVYQESESAWRSGHQRELSRLFDDLKRRKADICLVWALADKQVQDVWCSGHQPSGVLDRANWANG